MSHTVAVKEVAIKDAEALKQAIRDLRDNHGIRCELRENVRPRAYYTDQIEPCAYVLYLEDGVYDVGFKKEENGEFTILMDDYAGRISNHLKAACPIDVGVNPVRHSLGRFYQEYAKNEAINIASAQGYMVESCEFNEHGEIELEVSI